MSTGNIEKKFDSESLDEDRRCFLMTSADRYELFTY